MAPIKCVNGCFDAAHCRDADNCPLRVAGAARPPGNCPVCHSEAETDCQMSFCPYRAPDIPKGVAGAGGWASEATLRDYFAAEALPVAVTHLRSLADRGTYAAPGTSIAKVAASLAYEMADAMLEARKQ